MQIRVGIFGYGNLGRGIELALRQTEDMQLAAVFTRRNPATVTIASPDVPVCHADTVADWVGKIDVMVLCGGSASDLPHQTPALAKLFPVVDSFDNHANIPAHLARVDAAAREGGNAATVSVGWDPGMFSLNRFYAGAILPDGRDYTFWGEGVSQGHSDAIRRVKGVLDGKQYTVPVPEALEAVRRGEEPDLTAAEKHTRVCYVVAEEGADREEIRRTICEMPNYFAPYHTTVHFITREELNRDHSGIPHGGFVIRTGKTGKEGQHRHVIEYSLRLDSNPEFTASVLVAFARATHRLQQAGSLGCHTAFDIPPIYLSPMSREEAVANLL